MLPSTAFSPQPSSYSASNKCGGNGAGYYCPTPSTTADSSGGNPNAIQDVQNALGSTLTTVSGLQNLVQEVVQEKDQAASCVSGSCSLSGSVTTLGSDTNPLITVATGDLSISPSYTGGAGILLVEGNLTLNGAFTFDGLVLIIGKGTLIQKGSGNAGVKGGLFISQIPILGGCGAASSSFGCGSADPLNSNIPGKATYSQSGGGNMSVLYNSCNNDLVSKRASYTVVAWREVSY